MNKYLSYISDEHLLYCISDLHKSYLKARSKISKTDFYKNKVDVIKLLFDAKFNAIAEDDLLKNEVLRQMDKSTNNSIGTFHENILGGISGFQSGSLSGYDIKADDNSLFADIKNKHNTMNSSSAESLFQKLKGYADANKHAKCYWVQILAKSSFCELWAGDINGKEYTHSRVYKISGDKFYALLSGVDDAFFQLYNILPIAINDYLKTIKDVDSEEVSSVADEINEDLAISQRSIIDQITFDNYCYYLGFDKL